MKVCLFGDMREQGRYLGKELVNYSYKNIGRSKVRIISVVAKIVKNPCVLGASAGIRQTF